MKLFCLLLNVFAAVVTAVVVNLDEKEPGVPIVFGASGLAAINTAQGPDIFWLLRRIEIQPESWLNYVYSPFRG